MTRWVISSVAISLIYSANVLLQQLLSESPQAYRSNFKTKQRYLGFTTRSSLSYGYLLLKNIYPTLVEVAALSAVPGQHVTEDVVLIFVCLLHRLEMFWHISPVTRVGQSWSVLILGEGDTVWPAILNLSISNPGTTWLLWPLVMDQSRSLHAFGLYVRKFLLLKTNLIRYLFVRDTYKIVIISNI